MTKEDIIRKLTSRKLWIALVGLISGLLALFKVEGDTVTQIGGIVMAAGSVVAYILGEGWADAASAGSDVLWDAGDVQTKPPEDEDDLK
jgi:hypothetical protein